MKELKEFQKVHLAAVEKFLSLQFLRTQLVEILNQIKKKFSQELFSNFLMDMLQVKLQQKSNLLKDGLQNQLKVLLIKNLEMCLQS